MKYNFSEDQIYLFIHQAFTTYIRHYILHLEKEMATHCSILAGKSHGQRSLVGYSPWGHRRVRQGLVIKQQHFFCTEKEEETKVLPLLLRSLYSSKEDQKADTFSNQRIILGLSKVCSSFSTIQENLNERFDQPNTIRTERRVAWKQKEGTQPDTEG